MNLHRIYFLLLITFLSACSSRQEENADKTVFRYNDASGISSLDPAFAKDQSSIWACLQLYNGLLSLDADLNIQPSIAKSWDISPDGLQYTFHLRGDVLFHESDLFEAVEYNGQNINSRYVTAEDFVFSFKRLVDAKVASPGAWVMNTVQKDESGSLTGLKALNDSTLIITLRHSFPAFASLLTMPYCAVVPKEVVKNNDSEFRRRPCGTGPFRFSYWKEGVRLIFLKNQNYFEEINGEKLPRLDAVEISFIGDKQSAFIEFLKGKLDFLSGLDASYKDELLTRSGKLQPRHEGRFKLETLPYLNTEYLGILIKHNEESQDKHPLQNPKVRQALSLGFDKSSMMKYLRNNMGTPGIYGMIPPGMPGFDSASCLAYTYDIRKAKSLLAEAGYPEGKGLKEITLSTTSTYLDLCEYIKSQWENLGVKVKIDVNQAAIHRKMVSEQKLEFFRGSWIADYPDAENYLSLFHSGNFAPGGPNYTHYRNSEFDRLYSSASGINHPEERWKIYRKMDSLVMADAPVIILYYDKVLRLVSNEIQGLENNAMNMLVLKNVRKSVSTSR
ncbi:MAG: ABC transporter substrate-binding protein [Bacteroidetes bacterium]|nr:MAG: ABC transporter substrate-binding protein [Bacteroidota bacterium]REJ99903.1 MAG: ABC transporter substrate-binding protein [Bacteroidota bacterium]REK34276.1 MAG: ABC transporter substrate-binding protein [Bacteroidota bacterium]REK50606.1 MAG: ABC transporter substrate-binding protein [Bacteroidota bacterium]